MLITLNVIITFINSIKIHFNTKNNFNKLQLK